MSADCDKSVTEGGCQPLEVLRQHSGSLSFPQKGVGAPVQMPGDDKNPGNDDFPGTNGLAAILCRRLCHLGRRGTSSRFQTGLADVINAGC
jgi:hypothetical protein